MGEVYLAHDSKLGRDVAIKVLPEAFSKERERLERLEREARLLASLNHPNIATLYGFEQAEGIGFLVMERVPGETLADKLTSGLMPVDEALPIFLQIARGLEAAHERGIIHRDLKPANIKITEEGRVRILDFGLGKSLSVTAAPSTEGATQPVTPSPHAGTSEGMIVGTPAYMSPEQATGKPVDKRTDIWAFGCCLYETLTGKRSFSGETASDAIAKILETEPDWEALPKDSPPRIRSLLWRCLQKDLHRRLRDIGEARFEISEVQSGEAGMFALPGEFATAGRSRRSRTILVGLACMVLGLILGGVAIRSMIRPTPSTPPTTPAPPNVVRSVILPHSKIADEALFHVGLAISRDGKRLAYVDQGTGTERMLYVQELDESEARPVPGTEGAIDPFFSPDGESLGYSDHTRKVLKVVPIRGELR
jgi:serine/threonine protein kinase